ncbi:MAG: rhomboid family intramembrane serine protease [Gammaproteobacteria bacterium]|nr:rhomboid family intramembrane serine protease [Gammaproteobacteria bacterium]MBU1969095.1 rhomboid family intramembrane serine protease [Gammaproteobacteria bacterium]
MRNSPSVVWIIIFVTIAGFLLQISAVGAVLGGFALWPFHNGFMPWQLVTYAFLHGGLAHLAFNMYGLWMFGRELEYVMGKRAFLQLYFASILTAALAQLLVTNATGGLYPTIGASGGVFGVLLAYAMFFPNRTLMLIFPPIALPAWLFVTLYAGLELTFGVTGSLAGVAHFAHLGGMVGGYLVIRNWRRRGR